MTGCNAIAGLEELLQKLDPAVGEPLGRLPDACWESLQEIRLQEGRQVWLVFPDRLLSLGQLVSGAQKVTREQIAKSFAALCDYSVHTVLPQVVEGFVTVSGGHRIGLGGTAVLRDGKVVSMREMDSMNIRLARSLDWEGQASQLCGELFAQGLYSVLIAGEPGSGKTTLLRAMALHASKRWRVTVVDEREEMVDERLQRQAGCLDVLRGYPKAQGILQAVRTLSPQLVVCDELGSLSQAQELLQAVNCGVHFLCSIHAGSLAELRRRPQFQLLARERAFEKVALLAGSAQPGVIRQICPVQQMQDGCADEGEKSKTDGWVDGKGEANW